MKLERVFETLVVISSNAVSLDGEVLPAKVGKHEIWIPPKPGGTIGMKVVWSFNGKIESYRDWDKGKNAQAILDQTFNRWCEGVDEQSKISLSNEYGIFLTLSQGKMSPGVHGFFFIKNVTSFLPYGTAHNDPKGMYGFFMGDATQIPEGKFDKQKFLDLVNIGTIKISDGALGDVFKSDNIINGYLVDVRRSLFDMMEIIGFKGFENIWYVEDRENLKHTISELGQFPFKNRKQNYQSYFLDGEYVEGSRDTVYRMNQMQIPVSLSGMTVLDLGCCHGSIALECYRRGAYKITGLDIQDEYIQCARSIARANGFVANFLTFDITNIDILSNFVKNYYKKPVDIVFALSLFKHMPEKFKDIMSCFEWKTCFIESNNAPDGTDSGHAKILNELLKEWQKNGYTVQNLGMTEDRSPRVIWRVSK